MLQEAQDAFEAAGGFEADKRIANVLTGLGFKQTDWKKSCSEFSGGWQVRGQASGALSSGLDKGGSRPDVNPGTTLWQCRYTALHKRCPDAAFACGPELIPSCWAADADCPGATAAGAGWAVGGEQGVRRGAAAG